MAAFSGWKCLDVPLPLGTRLLIKSHFHNCGYSIQLTDLSRIWSENLSKDRIIQQAADTRTAIDASESDGQFLILMSKIESALMQEGNTSISLSSREHRVLQLDITAPLPHPLPALRWKLRLKCNSVGAIESQLLSPLIQQASAFQGQIEQLILCLHDKDRVISKITDRLETSGNDLTTVFPGVSNIKISRKRSQRDQLAKHVKGLTEFDESVWNNSRASSHADWRAMQPATLEAVLRNLPCPLEITESVEWWKYLEDERHLREDAVSVTLDREVVKHPNTQSEQNSISGGFQRQTSSPRLATERRHQPVDDERSWNVNGTGKQDAAETSVALFPSAEGTGDESSTDAGHEEDHDDTPGESPPPASASTSHKLGVLGGKAKPAASQHGGTPESRGQSKEDPAKVHKNLGAISGNKTSHLSEPHIPIRDSHRNEPIEKPSRGPSPPRETSQERADRRRDQLKRELDVKANTLTTKKRKF